MTECIERSVAIARITALEVTEPRATMADVMRVLVDMPAADVAPVRHGRWITHSDDLFPADSTIECSVCHEEETAYLCNDNYCPNCGAMMDGGDKHETD